MNIAEQLQRQPVLQAPMCGISDYPYRSICRREGAGMTYTQMVSAEAIWRGDTKTLTILDQEPGESPLAMQLFGGQPEAMAHAAGVLQDRGAALIDINMGCPARKITVSHAGSALLRDLDRTRAIFRAMRRVVRVPLTVKMRWDWDDGDGAALAAARIAQDEGLDAVCLHGRTRQQGYSGEANWELIARMKEALDIPVIGNGDIRSGADALEMMRLSGCDAVMIGRGIIGDPWLLGECLEAVRERRAPELRPAVPWEARRATMLEHARLMFERKGPHGLIQFRKHAAMYLRGLRGAKQLRVRLMQVETMEGLEAALDEMPAAEPVA